MAHIARRLVPAVAVLTLLAGVGIATGAIPDSGGVIHGCYQKNHGQLRVIDTDQGQTCDPAETALNWNQTGPAGAAGPAGPAGPQGPAGTARDVGSVQPGTDPQFRSEGLKGWQSITHVATGAYCLTPDPSTTLENAIVMLSVGNDAGGGPGFAIQHGVCTAVPLAYLVETFDASGQPSDDITFNAVVP